MKNNPVVKGRTKIECIRGVRSLEGKGYECVHPIREKKEKKAVYSMSGLYIGDEIKTTFYAEMTKVKVNA